VANAEHQFSEVRFAGETWRTLFANVPHQDFFLALSDDFSARTASELCGVEDRLKVRYNISESGHERESQFAHGQSHRASCQRDGLQKATNTQTDFVSI